MITSSEKIKILVIDDDSMFLSYIQALFEDEAPEFQILIALDGPEGIQIIKDIQPALVLLDVRMQRMDGYHVCKQIREFSRVPVIMLTGKADGEDRVAGFQAGADDYVAKPFYPAELIARIKAVLNRSQSGSESPNSVFCHRDLRINFSRCEVTLNGETVNLTATEYKLLVYFAAHVNQVVAPPDVIRDIWGEKYIQGKHILQVNIARLRQKLDDPQGLLYIQTRPGLGYILTD